MRSHLASARTGDQRSLAPHKHARGRHPTHHMEGTNVLRVYSDGDGTVLVRTTDERSSRFLAVSLQRAAEQCPDVTTAIVFEAAATVVDELSHTLTDPTMLEVEIP